MIKYAEQWEKIDIRLCDENLYSEFRNVTQRLSTYVDQNTFEVHESCSTTFRTRLKRKLSQAKKLDPMNLEQEEHHETAKPQDVSKKRKFRCSRDDTGTRGENN